MNQNKHMGLSTLYRDGKKFVRDIQRSDETRRKKWFIGGSIVSVCFILLLWAIYVSIALPKTSPPEGTSPKQENNIKDDQPSVFEIFERGITNISNDFKKRFGGFRGAIEKNFRSAKGSVEEKNTSHIQGARLNFVFDNIEPIPPTRLP
jgi:hypothetical protein